MADHLLRAEESILAAFCGFLLLLYSVVMKALFHQPSGYTTIVVALCFLFALTFVVIGIIGDYIAILMQETKQRPIDIVEECVNIEKRKGNIIASAATMNNTYKK